MKETPVNKIMENTLEKMREMVDVSTIIGDPMVTGDTTLIPVSKVTYGFTSGGTDLPTKQQNQELFGGGGGGGRLQCHPARDYRRDHHSDQPAFLCPVHHPGLELLR